MEESGPGGEECPRLGGRVGVVDCHLVVVALVQPHRLAAPQVNGRVKIHTDSSPQSSAKARSIRSPVSPDFSGWNWVPYTSPLRTAPVTGMLYSLVASV